MTSRKALHRLGPTPQAAPSAMARRSYRHGLVGPVVLALMLVPGGCGFAPDAGPGYGTGGTGPGHRPQRLALSPEEELEVGRQAYREVVSEFRNSILPADFQEVQRSRAVASRIAQTTRIRPLLREINIVRQVEGYQFEWEVNVVRKGQVNAFCLPAGKIVVFSGLLSFAPDDDELAAVLGHEIAHALAHHSSERVAREQATGGGLGGIFGSLKFDRQQESEADHIGVFLMTFAGYNPDGAVRFWRRMEEGGPGGQIPEILSDHPSHAHRLHDLEQWAQAARAGKQAFDEGKAVKD
jgi:predicted Zn-dependent protease